MKVAAIGKTGSLGNRLLPSGRLDLSNFFTPLRLALALIVALEHIVYIQADRPSSPFEVGHTGAAYLAVNAFFIISGYLITSSAARSPHIMTFLRSRALRIIPALFFAGVFIAFGLGPFMTTVSPAEYFWSWETWDFTYQLITFQNPEPPLAGVEIAGTSWSSDMTGPIWTLRYEMLAYVGTAAFLILGLQARRWPIIGALALVSIGFAFDLQTQMLLDISATVASALRFGSCYLLGALLFTLPVVQRPKGWTGAVIGLAAFIAGCLIVANGTPAGEIVMNAGLAVLLISVAFMPVSAPRWLTHPPDISYGLYIFHWPIYQLINQKLGTAPNAPLLLFIGLPTALLLATLSWYLIEKPSLRLKHVGGYSPPKATHGQNL